MQWWHVDNPLSIRLHGGVKIFSSMIKPLIFNLHENTRGAPCILPFLEHFFNSEDLGKKSDPHKQWSWSVKTIIYLFCMMYNIIEVVNAGSQDAEVEISVMTLEFILWIKVVKLQMRNDAILRKLYKSLHKLTATKSEYSRELTSNTIPYNSAALLNHCKEMFGRFQSKIILVGLFV